MYILSDSLSVLNFVILRSDAYGNINVTGKTTFNLGIYGQSVLVSSIQIRLLAPPFQFAVLFNDEDSVSGNSTLIITGNLAYNYGDFFLNLPMVIQQYPINKMTSTILTIMSPSSISPPITWLIAFSGVDGSLCNIQYFLVDFGTSNLLTSISGVTSNLKVVCSAPVRSQSLGNGLFQISDPISSSLVYVDFVARSVKTLDITAF